MGDFDLTVRCIYSCRQCGVSKASVDVPARGFSEDVVHWVREVVARAISADHDKRSPGCHITKLDEVYIPMTGSDRIGDPAKQ